MTICPDDFFEKALVYIPGKSRNQWSTAGLELVRISRIALPENLVIGHLSSSLWITDLKTIEKNKTNEKIKKFNHYLNECSQLTCDLVRNEISMVPLIILQQQREWKHMKKFDVMV